MLSSVYHKTSYLHINKGYNGISIIVCYQSLATDTTWCELTESYIVQRASDR